MTKRCDVFDPTDPAIIPSEQRLHEVAAILATGVIRMREQPVVTIPNVRPCRNWVRSTGSARRPAATRISKILPESGENRLEVPRGSSPDGQCG